MYCDRCKKKKKEIKYHLDGRPFLFRFFIMSLFKHFPGWDASFLNGVISIKEALTHIDLNFLSVFFQLADDFNIHGWVEWVLFSPSQAGGNAWELPVGPKRCWQAPCQANRAAVKTLILTNKDRSSSGLRGKIRSLIPLSSILNVLFYWALTDRVSYEGMYWDIFCGENC